jgi:hypothetical protein
MREVSEERRGKQERKKVREEGAEKCVRKQKEMLCRN